MLLAGLGRAKGLIDSAMGWTVLAIARDLDSLSGAIRGSLLRYVIAYSGWELLAKTLQWNGRKVYQSRSINAAFDRLLEPTHHLMSPHPSSYSAPEALTSWLSGDHGKHERDMPTFLGLSKPLQPFPRWLVGKADSLSNQQMMAAMRHVVAHGVLSPTKASQWGLRDLYQQGSSHV